MNKYMLLVSLFIYTTVIYSQSASVYLTSSVIEFLDGKTWGINGEAIGYMRQVGLQVIKMQYGTLNNATGKRVGIFEFKGMPYSIKELITLNKNLLQRDSLYSWPLHGELKNCFIHVVDYFINIIEPFMGQARGAKQQVVILIAEWADKHNRTESDLLRWAETTEGKEFEVFRQKINSFEQLDNFCTDLVCFLGDLMRSCPKANKQFELLKEQFLAQQNK